MEISQKSVRWLDLTRSILIFGFLGTGKNISRKISLKYCSKNFAEFICHSENFDNFVIGEDSDKSILFDF